MKLIQIFYLEFINLDHKYVLKLFCNLKLICFISKKSEFKQALKLKKLIDIYMKAVIK